MPVADRLLLSQLLADWHHINYRSFGDAMQAPALQISGTTAELASWRSVSRTIQVSRALIESQPWGVVCEVLRHEMAHQYVDEVLGVRDEGPHGPTFQKVCAQRGIDASSKGLPQHVAAESEDAKVIAKIQRLLALAQSDNEHEAEAAMAAAQRLMLKHNIALGQRVGAAYAWRHLGEITERRPSYTKLLAAILTRHFFVEAVWVDTFDPAEGKTGTVLEILGTPENLEIAAYVWDFLLRAAEGQWQAHKRAKGIRADGGRRAYFNGLMVGFREKLDAQKQQHQTEGLVWVGDPDLDRYLGRRFPRLQQGRGFTLGDAGAFAQGRAAGATIVLHRGVGGEGGNQGRMITTRS